MLVWLARHGITLGTLWLAGLVLAQPARAVELAPDGVGDVLIFPYFTVQRDSSTGPPEPSVTLLTVINESDRIKATRVRFYEARLGRAIYETVVYLGPQDIWVAAVLPLGEGAGVFTPDPSCAAPSVSNDPNSPSPFGLDPISELVLIPPEETREGHVEVFQMGDYGPGVGAPAGSVAAAVMPVFSVGGTPADCPRVRTDDGSESVVMPGTLSGSAIQINVFAGTEFSQRATALRNFNTERTLWSRPSNGRPTLADAAPVVSVIHDSKLGTVRTQWNQPIDAVSAVLMRSALSGEFLLDKATRSQTSWVVSMPTKRHYVVDGQQPRAPFTAGGTSGLAGELMPHEIRGGLFDRNGKVYGISGGFIPPTYYPRALFWTDTVIAFNTPGLFGSAGGFGSLSGYSSSALAATPWIRPVLPPFENGWMRLPLHLDEPPPQDASNLPFSRSMVGGATTILRTDGMVESRPSITIYGLPVIGFVATTFANGAIGTLPDGRTVLSNYGSSVPLNGEILLR